MEDKIYFAIHMNHFLFYDEPIIKPKDVPDGNEINMGKAIDYVEKRLREVERQDILKAQLKVKFGDISDNLYEQIMDKKKKKLKTLTVNIFNVTNEEDVLRIIN